MGEGEEGGLEMDSSRGEEGEGTWSKKGGKEEVMVHGREEWQEEGEGGATEGREKDATAFRSFFLQHRGTLRFVVGMAFRTDNLLL